MVRLPGSRKPREASEETLDDVCLLGGLGGCLAIFYSMVVNDFFLFLITPRISAPAVIGRAAVQCIALMVLHILAVAHCI